MQLPPKVSERAFERLVEIDPADQVRACASLWKAADAVDFNMISAWTVRTQMIWC